MSIVRLTPASPLPNPTCRQKFMCAFFLFSLSLTHHPWCSFSLTQSIICPITHHQKIHHCRKYLLLVSFEENECIFYMKNGSVVNNILLSKISWASWLSPATITPVLNLPVTITQVLDLQPILTAFEGDEKRWEETSVCLSVFVFVITEPDAQFHAMVLK